MSQSAQGRPMGRPRKGLRTLVSLRMSKSMNADFVDLADHLGQVKSDTLATLVIIGLTHPDELKSRYAQILASVPSSDPALPGLPQESAPLHEYLIRIPTVIDRQVQDLARTHVLRKPVILVALAVIGSQRLDDFASALTIMHDAALRPSSLQALAAAPEVGRQLDM